jgi:hypothetical protein
MRRFSVRIREVALSWPTIVTCAIGAVCLMTLSGVGSFLGFFMGATVAAVVGVLVLKSVRKAGPVSAPRWVRAEVRVGADGIAVATRRATHFISHLDIADAYSPEAGRVLVQRRDGTVEEIRTGEGSALLAAIEDAAERSRASRSFFVPQLLCAPGEEDHLAARAPTMLRTDAYREQGIEVREAERTATDSSADPIARAAAMRALAEAPAETRAKMRVVVEETAEPVLREVLADALEGTLEGDALRRLRAR